MTKTQKILSITIISILSIAVIGYLQYLSVKASDLNARVASLETKLGNQSTSTVDTGTFIYTLNSYCRIVAFLSEKYKEVPKCSQIDGRISLP